MNQPTKEELSEALKKASEGIFEGVELYFLATGTGGCSGPPCVMIREPVSPELISSVHAEWMVGLMKLPIEDRIIYQGIFKTAAVAYIEKNAIFYPITKEKISTDIKVGTVLKADKFKRYYYKKYTDVDALATVLIRALKKRFNVKVV